MRRYLGIALAVLAAAAAPSTAAGAAEGTVRGVVTAGGAGRPGVAIEVYLERRRSAGGAPFAVSESGPGGAFALALPPGEYFLWAKAPAPSFGPPLVTEHPENPVQVLEGRETLLGPLALREAGRQGEAAAPGNTGISGRVTHGGRAAAEASVMVYAAAAQRLTGPGFAASVLTGDDGRFQADLAPGSYRLAVRRRADGAAAGRLRPGDLAAELPGEAVAVREGSYTDVGELALHAVDPGKLAERERREGAGPTRLAGRVTDAGGRPLAGQFVFAYRDQGMIGRPDLMAVTGGDGAFLLDLPSGGTWFLGARSTMGGPRQPGEMAGRLEGSPDSSVALREGETRRGLLVRMETVW